MAIGNKKCTFSIYGLILNLEYRIVVIEQNIIILFKQHRGQFFFSEDMEMEK